ncbi:MAG: SHOCT domain-containing protein [Gammaproteobacteria bacterium]|nr:SHOCT domain-containing protein [Gammaproteobacteria bacterium]
MFSKINIVRFLLALLVTASWSPLARADEDIWKSGLNLYVRLTEQDDAASGRPVPNQHPVNLDPAAIANSLIDIQVWDKHWFKKDEIEEVFSPEQARLLGQQLAIALRKASPGQDIVFAVSRTDTKFLGFRDLSYTAGRAFYSNDRLNIIIGDFMRPPDKFQERATSSAGVMEIKYYFRHGRRDDPSDFESAVMTGDGVEVYNEGGKRRLDWLVIDVNRASAARLAEEKAGEEANAPVSDEALRQEAARFAQERREMRLEMARMRKEVGSGQTGAESTAPIESRLKTLDELRQKKLISDEEYERKRQDILNDL